MCCADNRPHPHGHHPSSPSVAPITHRYASGRRQSDAAVAKMKGHNERGGGETASLNARTTFRCQGKNGAAPACRSTLCFGTEWGSTELLLFLIFF